MRSTEATLCERSLVRPRQQRVHAAGPLDLHLFPIHQAGCGILHRRAPLIRRAGAGRLPCPNRVRLHCRGHQGHAPRRSNDRDRRRADRIGPTSQASPCAAHGEPEPSLKTEYEYLTEQLLLTIGLRRAPSGVVRFSVLANTPDHSEDAPTGLGAI